MLKHYQVRLLYPLVGTVVSIMFFIVYWNIDSNKFISLPVTLLGLAIWWMATITLGKSFSLIPKATALVQKGIYSKVRHPIYWGASITALGWVILIQTNVMVFIMAVIISSSIVRASLEEKKLVETFGEKYVSYKKRTWF